MSVKKTLHMTILLRLPEKQKNFDDFVTSFEGIRSHRLHCIQNTEYYTSSKSLPPFKVNGEQLLSHIKTPISYAQSIFQI